MNIVLRRSWLLPATLGLLVAGSALPAEANPDGMASDTLPLETTMLELPAESHAAATEVDMAPPVTAAQQPIQSPQLLSEVRANTSSVKSAAALEADTLTPVVESDATATPAPDSTLVAQEIDPGRATRSGSSYLGFGGNIGLTGGSSDIGRGSFAVISKIGLTNVLSLRPAVFINQDTTINIPLTFDYSPRDPVDLGFTIAPYFGGGIAISTGRDSRVGPLLTAGVDVPISRELTATAGLNLAFLRNTDLGLFVGIGYNFSGF